MMKWVVVDKPKEFRARQIVVSGEEEETVGELSERRKERDPQGPSLPDQSTRSLSCCAPRLGQPRKEINDAPLPDLSAAAVPSLAKESGCCNFVQ